MYIVSVSRKLFETNTEYYIIVLDVQVGYCLKLYLCKNNSQYGICCIMECLVQYLFKDYKTISSLYHYLKLTPKNVPKLMYHKSIQNYVTPLIPLT